MRFPDVSRLGTATIEGAAYVVLLVREDWDWDSDGSHDSDHAGGRCECPCSQPLDMLLEAAEVKS